jgi:hypothetical protein
MRPGSALKGASKQIVESMTGKQLEELARAIRKDKPGHLAGD